ncbi:MAG: hypothetical protein LBV16_08675 [Elusimicrobiota bacterium]|jgi:hypothetical protein|nr:hypothetical protein [Elusimicrobiota bacterium]
MRIKRNSGQAMLESLFVVFFTSVIMLCFIQVCLIVVDDLTANEAAFVGMRSAAVTKQEKADSRISEAKSRIVRYLLWYGIFPLPVYLQNDFGTSSRDTVAPYYKRDGANQDDIQSDGYVSIAPMDKNKKFKDFSGKEISAQILQVYYATKVFWRDLTASGVSANNYMGAGGIRYQASRAAMIPSPDEEYYDKAFPKAKKFD